MNVVVEGWVENVVVEGWVENERNSTVMGLILD
jgi:hypothetical protein